jgi:hypothetical protein
MSCPRMVGLRGGDALTRSFPGGLRGAHGAQPGAGQGAELLVGIALEEDGPGAARLRSGGPVNAPSRLQERQGGAS